MRLLEPRKNLLKIGAAASLCALLAVLVAAVGTATAGKADALEAKLAKARDEASSLSSQLQATTAELAGAEAEAAKAQAREEKVTTLLVEGREHAAELASKLEATKHRLEVEKARLQRSRQLLADRLVAIYESGTPDAATLVLEADDYQDLVARNDYLRAINEADSALAERVAEVRAAVHQEVLRVADLEAEAVAYDEQLEAARAEIASVREAAEASAARLQSLSASREASLATLKSDIAEWVDEIQEARAAEAREASEAEAEEEVGRWLGGPYSIPTYIVMCESGGNYSALNPSSGAGGAYQILPSTWELYGGQGEPQNAPKAEQDRIAAEIWADSGSSAWVCG
ncbi:MAG TPA: transglycosylase family protein [Solirubrobacterales bacterium]|nr:transglycosylase family protein [Solirubrobacterales bacterium]